ncbi:T9SS type A sorting domain-containing protein [Aureibaculum sp. A20]|uniref:T9SS type A sorting domain-containing protein n=1 Tax=Aureibaculum flavum TaxID=2795986 RepID=A0ABS0WTU2_9FLAO|nr:T9SS type A sorting domain-containing protein [Aureibaculum flavum]MBJ2175412.1 T9SS type A sorting domain-containing protein [Aureibaculum flavum]
MKKLLFLFILSFINVNAQDVPFNCDYNAYLFQNNDVYAIDLASGNSYTVATDITKGSVNATAYNPADGFIWGSLSSPEKSIVRIGKNFQTTTYYIDELPSSSRYVGDVSSKGIYYLKGGGKTYYKIDLNPESDNYTKYIGTENLSQSISVHDWAFNAVDGNLYAVEKKTNILYRINPETSNVQSLGVVPILTGLNYTYGAVYFDASGRFYVSANQTGTIYVIQKVQDLNGKNGMDSNLFAFGPSSSSNDGARCPTAPVVQEDCTNGIDDDGDGLIDCEDPSCSGYAACPVLVAPTSTANSGGLESNNRLSQQISKRNFERTKTSYKFDKATAKKLSKSMGYAKKSNKVGIELTDFIPFGTIGEDNIIESSPTDLIKITNATNIYSVDYMKENQAVASILLLETEKGVYEHTKYICDRLLGAELISVSTIEIKEQQFIKALIRNIDGSLEFVLSLSAKPTNSNSNFEIESHWNLDRYEKEVPYYNFQIWSNSLDDLLKLGEEVLNLLDVQKPVTSYNNSTPPTVFVRKGKYINGKLDLEIVNTNKSKSVVFDGGLRASETGFLEYVSTNVDLDGNYISNVQVDAGNLFDIGFRIGDGLNTPDDLFMSDGPWGYDDAAPSTSVMKYNIESNDYTFNDDDFPIERNIEIEATTSEYIAAYRALTPKFSPIDLSDYNSLKLKAKGTGTLIIRLVKKGISNWEIQFKTSITLTENLQDFTVPFSDFTSNNGESLELTDVTSLVFTMLAESGAKETKEMNLKQLRFSTGKTLAVENVNSNDNLLNPIAVPNPMINSTKIHFTSEHAEKVTLLVYSQLGSLIKQVSIQTVVGKNEIPLNRDNLSPGIYLCKVKSNYVNYKTTKLIVK